MEKKRHLELVFILSIIYMELLFSAITLGVTNIMNIKMIYIILFIVIVSSVFSIISKIGNNKVNIIVMLVILFLLGFYFFASYLFKDLFNTYFSIHLAGVSDQAFQFLGATIAEIFKRFYMLLLFLLPFFLCLRYKKNISYEKSAIEYISLALGLILFNVCIRCNQEINELYFNVDNNAMNIEKMGVTIATYLDFKRVLFPVKENILLEEDIMVDDKNNNNNENNESENEIVYEPNMLDIDFDSLISKEKNSTIKSMHEYFKNATPTLKTEYTGKYKDKNLIVVMGESLNTIAISEKYTPTLYKLTHEKMEFTNFYTPVNLSTLGGEFQNLTGLFANLSVLSNYFRKGNNYYPYGLGNVFNKLDYKVQAYHANSGYFQDRNKYLKNMGFDSFTFNGNGLEKKMNCNQWPQSDLSMVDVTTDDFIDSEKFMTYYVSVSGHMPWSWSGNSMSYKNKDLVADLKMSEEAKAYIAANIELDKALELLINRLEEKNILDDTVIVVVPDHYPYSMNIKTINELSDYERDEKFEVNHSSLIIYNSQDEHVVIDKAITQLDVLPTILNLFGVEYDSRLIMGKDIFSTTSGLVYFNDRSWLTDYGRFDVIKNKFYPNEGQEIPEDYISKINKVVSSRINMSKLIMENNYYKIVLGD